MLINKKDTPTKSKKTGNTNKYKMLMMFNEF